MDLLDEFKYQSYKSRIESLTGTKKPLVDLLKELTTKYATDSYTITPEEQVSNLYYVLLTNLIVTNCSAKSIMSRDIIITLSSHDNQLLGMIVAKIRSYRKPEPYKGKGIKFVGEIIRRKAGKSA